MKLNSQKFMGPDDMNPSMLRKLADAAKPLSIKFEKAWQSGKVHGHWKKRIIIIIFKKIRKEDMRN